MSEQGYYIECPRCRHEAIGFEGDRCHDCGGEMQYAQREPLTAEEEAEAASASREARYE